MLRSARLVSRRTRWGAVAALAALTLTLSGCQPAGDQATEQPATTATSSAPVTDATPDQTPGAGTLTYVAMGDSYTAAPLFALGNRHTIDSCLRSDSNYPTLVARHLDVDGLDVSCSGASTTSMFSKQKFSSTSLPPQLDALSDNTDLVTLGIGANDFRYFSKMIYTCLRVATIDPEGAPCRERNTTPAGRDRIEKHLGEIRHNVARVVRAIGKRAPQARILLVGYPQLLPSDGTTCRSKLPLAVGDYPYVIELNLRLSRAVEQGGTRSGADFVDLVEASQGHDICSSMPWVAGVQGAPDRAMGLHPYPAEQRAVANLVIARL